MLTDGSQSSDRKVIFCYCRKLGWMRKLVGLLFPSWLVRWDGNARKETLWINVYSIGARST